LVGKLEFDFDKIAVLGFPINLPKGKAAEVRNSMARAMFL